MARILVIDDELSVVKMITRLLKPSGYEIVSCCRPDEADALVEGVDLILCDMHLGQASGIDLILHLRQHGFDGPVIMVSGDRTRDTVMGCIQAGVVDYVVKPFTRAILMEKLTKHLSQRATHVAEICAT